MASKDQTMSAAERLVAEARKHQTDREKTYRGQALKMYPWVCGRCTREFTNKNLQELTVHHKNHNHDDNPADGSNWELLCLYCHDNEHSKYEEMQHGSLKTDSQNNSGGSHNPFAGLGDLLKK
jgi:uncharacterized metal-binding protein YceD (DUF177 family)